MNRVPLLALESVSKNFGSDFLLDDISTDLAGGEVHMLIGENGSGKSALMQIVSGLWRQDAGTMTLDGVEVSFGSIAESRAAGIHYQPQDPQLFGNLGVAENLFADRKPGRGAFRNLVHDRYGIYEECLRLFDRIGIMVGPETPIDSLGYAERLLVSAARSLVTEARIVILDEPTAGMDDRERQILFGIVRELRDQGRGIFYITHRLDEIGAIGDRVTVIHQGRVAGRLPDAAVDRGTLISMMTGSIRVERYPKIKVESGPVVLEVEELECGRVLDKVSFSLRKGEIVGLMGLMGSGRTRLANCLFGKERPSGGRIRVGGREARIRHPADAMRLGLALVPEDRDQNALFHSQDVVSNMTVASLPRFKEGPLLDTGYMGELTDEYVRGLGINPVGNSEQLRSYSGGNQQKVIVARWLMSLCRVFILDEPTRGVDAAARIDIYNAMNDLLMKGASILLISSEVEEILGMCDRILVLARGKIACDLPRSEVTKDLIFDYASG